MGDKCPFSSKRAHAVCQSTHVACPVARTNKGACVLSIIAMECIPYLDTGVEHRLFTSGSSEK